MHITQSSLHDTEVGSNLTLDPILQTADTMGLARAIHGRAVINSMYDNRRRVLVDFVDHSIGTTTSRPHPFELTVGQQLQRVFQRGKT